MCKLADIRQFVGARANGVRGTVESARRSVTAAIDGLGGVLSELCYFLSECRRFVLHAGRGVADTRSGVVDHVSGIRSSRESFIGHDDSPLARTYACASLKRSSLISLAFTQAPCRNANFATDDDIPTPSE
jgi:hypothetical protein